MAQIVNAKKVLSVFNLTASQEHSQPEDSQPEEPTQPNDPLKQKTFEDSLEVLSLLEMFT
jgi:hypothetical protein